MVNKLIHFTAKHKDTGQQVDLYYYTLANAKRFNPYFEDFQEVGYKTN